MLLHIVDSIGFGEVRKDPSTSKSCDINKENHIRILSLETDENDFDNGAEMLSHPKRLKQLWDCLHGDCTAK